MLTANAQVKPFDTESVKQELLDRIGSVVAERATQRSTVER